MTCGPRRMWTVVLAVVLLGGWAHSAGEAALLDGLGAMGDSSTDEYQFYTHDPGDRSYARSWVEILAETRGLNFGDFTLRDRGSPRHQGYAYNWARTRATAHASFNLGPNVDFRPFTQMGQHTGLARQVAAGKVTLTFLFIGNNDFLQFFLRPIENPRSRLRALPGRMMRNVETAVRTVLGADPDVKMVIATLPDITIMPAAQRAIDRAISQGRLTRAQAEALVAGIRSAIGAYNSMLRALASQVNQREGPQRIAMADVHALVAEIFDGEPLVVGGVRIDKDTPGVGVEHLFAPDGIHPNTIFNGMLANLFLETINEQFGADVELLSEQELVRFARSTGTVVPTPPALPLGIMGLAVAGLFVRRRRRK